MLAIVPSNARVKGNGKTRQYKPRRTKMIWGCKEPASAEFKDQGRSFRRTTMRNKLPLLALSLVLGTGWAWAAPPTTDSQATENIQSRLDHAKVNKHGDVQVTYAKGRRDAHRNGG